jgi:IS30 family transposase
VRALEIAERLRITAHTVAVTLQRAGGVAPSDARSSRALTEVEREEITRGVCRGDSIRKIAQALKRAPSTVSRELKRNYGRARYRAVSAERKAFEAARRPKLCKLGANARLRRLVTAKLELHWSPQQIAEWLRRKFGSASMTVSHETIYRTLFVQARNVFKKELCAHLRTGRSRRRPRRESTNDTASIVDGISIANRPAEVEDRAVPGHWEGDLLFGTVNSYIATLVERQTRFCILVKIPSKDAKVVANAIAAQMMRLPTHLRKSLTWDRGSEMAGHKQFSIDTNIDVFFCDPRSPWQRGSNENTNGLLRQYFPTGQDVSHYSQAQLDRVAYQLNGRPRKTLDYKNPAEKLNELLR